MFLTRLGPTAQCVITGDLSQIDLPYNQKSGLYRAMQILRHVDGIAEVELNVEDVVRHRLVKEIINAYEKSDKALREKAEKAEKSARKARGEEEE